MSEIELGKGPGGRLAGKAWIFTIALFQLAAAVLLLYVLVRIWPHPTPSQAAKSDDKPSQVQPGPPVRVRADPCGNCKQREAAARSEYRDAEGKMKFDPECVSIFGWEVLLWSEQRLLLLVLLAGALGGFVRGVRSLYWYVGNRSLVVSWIPMYFLLPLSGSLVALFLYLIFRGGLFSPQSSVSDTSPFGFTAIAALAGMFSGAASEKLKDIFEMLFKREPPARDTAANPKPTVTSILPPISAANTAVTLTVAGSGFVKDSVVTADAKELQTTFVSESTVRASLTAADVPTAGAKIKIAVKNPPPGGGTSDPVEFVIT
ncbi:MAG TPA: IPT/TIG domain-containing protein [Thermoanaerobaculia bacterium]|nr:IPT/TIG domain-containing protein [Thermoanaerobaculia bacterium]